MKLGNSVLDGKWSIDVRGFDGSMWRVGRAILGVCPNFQGVSNNFFYKNSLFLYFTTQNTSLSSI